jgi:structural maintenance of chromosome 2
MRSVTVDGDIYDPSGSLSGGSKPSSSGLLLKVQELVGVRSELHIEQQKLDQITTSLEDCSKKITTYNKLKNTVDLKTHEHKLLEEQLMCDADSQVLFHFSATAGCYLYYKLDYFERSKPR